MSTMPPYEPNPVPPASGPIRPIGGLPPLSLEEETEATLPPDEE